MEILCSRIQLKPDSVDRVREWAATLNNRQAEVLETLRNEGIYLECAFLDHREDGDWLVYIIKAEDMAKGWEIFQNSTLPIDEYHKKFMAEVALKRENLETLTQFDRHDEAYGWD